MMEWVAKAERHRNMIRNAMIKGPLLHLDAKGQEMNHAVITAFAARLTHVCPIEQTLMGWSPTQMLAYQLKEDIRAPDSPAVHGYIEISGVSVPFWVDTHLPGDTVIVYTPEHGYILLNGLSTEGLPTGVFA